MRLSGFLFAPPWWGAVATLLCVALFVTAGIWQIQRGQAKQRMLTQQRVASKSPPRPLLPALSALQRDAGAAALYGKHFVISGRYVGEQQILLDNQVRKGRVGYHVWTPLLMANGQLLLVDRGWIPLPASGRETIPLPKSPRGGVTASGVLRHLPEPGIRLGATPRCDSAAWPRRLNYPTIDTIRCLYQAPVVDAVLLLDEGAPHGFVRNWGEAVEMPPMRHYGYAFQWFAMAVAVVVVFLVVNMKRIR